MAAVTPARPGLGDTGGPTPLPQPRGPASAALLKMLTGEGEVISLPVPLDDPLTGEDAPLALYLC